MYHVQNDDTRLLEGDAVVKGKRYSKVLRYTLQNLVKEFVYFDEVLLGIINTDAKTGAQYVSTPDKETLLGRVTNAQ